MKHITKKSEFNFVLYGVFTTAHKAKQYSQLTENKGCARCGT